MSDQPEEETMTTDPAAMLDAAAARLRELAGAATEGPWLYWPGCVVTISGAGDEDLPVVSNQEEDAATPADAAYIAAMSPPVALALADWLEREGQSHVHVGGKALSVYSLPAMDGAPALAVARAILGQDADGGEA